MSIVFDLIINVIDYLIIFRYFNFFSEKRNIEIVKLILKHLNKPESLIEHVEDRKGHDYRYAIDPTKIKNELGWEPKTKFEDGIIKTIDWYLENPEWLK